MTFTNLRIQGQPIRDAGAAGLLLRHARNVPRSGPRLHDADKRRHIHTDRPTLNDRVEQLRFCAEVRKRCRQGRVKARLPRPHHHLEQSVVLGFGRQRGQVTEPPYDIGRIMDLILAHPQGSVPQTFAYVSGHGIRPMNF